MKYQKGMTIIELMIAVALGIVLVTGVINLSITVNRSVDVSDGLSRNQETGRFAMDYLTQYIRRAGYSEDSSQTPLSLYVLGDTERHCVAAVSEACAQDDRQMSNDERSNIAGDRLALPFHASQEMTTCTGEVVSGNQTYVNVFWVNANRQLLCRVFNASTRTWHSAGNATVINGIENMQIQMGMAAEKEDREATSYKAIDAANNLNLIRSIRVSILVSSQDPSDDSMTTVSRHTETYGLLDSEPVQYNDSFLRHIFTNTVDLPNMIATAK